MSARSSCARDWGDFPNTFVWLPKNTFFQLFLSKFFNVCGARHGFELFCSRLRQGWQVFREYVDTGFSGADDSRPELDRLLRDARLRPFEAVLVWKLDRWGRSVAHCVRSIEELVSLGIRFLSPSESIDTGAESPMSKFLLHLLAAFAEMEREIIRERVRAGVRNAKAKGARLGRPQRVFRRDEAQRLRAQGISWRGIARTLEVPMSTVIDACRSEIPH